MTRVSISEDALTIVSGEGLCSLIEDKIDGLVTVHRDPFIVLTLERTARDENSDRYPIVPQEGMAPIVVAILRAGASDESNRGGRELSEHMRRCASQMAKAYDLGPIPRFRDAIAVLIEMGYVSLGRDFSPGYIGAS